jgi:predicted house-cleaning NTP pyrophosphatase (Maf/HAM1 superfamily)
MSSPEQLACRVDRTEEDLRAIADTVVDVNTRVQAMQKTQRDHTTTLMNVRGKVENVETRLAAVQQVQHEQSDELAEIKTAVVEILRRLDSR